MINKVLDYAEKNHMFEKNDYVVAGVSGGADSVCLLFVLLEIKKRIPITIHVVHINHGIREEAGEDAAYVEKLCKENDIRFTLVEKDVEALAKKNHISSEEAGRQVRYQAFNDAIKENGQKGKIAIAHNMNDSSETFMFNLFRGSGLKGLSGIRPVRGNIVRPLLCVQRAEIEEYLDQKNIHYCIDRTNNEDNYTRNRIRHHILPAATDMVSTAAITHISQAADKINDACELLDELSKDGYDRCVTKDKGRMIIDEKNLLCLHPTIQSYVVRLAMSELSGSSKDIEGIHINQILSLFEKQCGRAIDLPYGITASRDYTSIILCKKSVEKKDELYILIGNDKRERLETGEELQVSINDEEKLKFSIFDCTGKEEIEPKAYTKWLDYDKIKGDIVVRNRQTGDYLTINSNNHKQSLKAFFINEKIPKEKRDKMILIADDKHCLWIVGNRISNYYKVDKNTRRILEVTYQGGKQWQSM